MLQPPFQRLLVANRGEIAIRIFRAATELGIRTIGIYSYEDRFALYRFKADEAYQVGEQGKPLQAYLDYRAIVALAKKLRVDAIHPGYGFLSENADFASLCREEGIAFIGPSVDVLRAFGDKVRARGVALEAGLPVIPGTDQPVDSAAEALSIAEAIGYPVTLKAVSGGGGKGIRMMNDAKGLAEAFERARSEAMSSFGRADIYIEKMIPAPKHIEVQILGDQDGQIVHLFERDCSIQRRHQKVVEVAPALGISEETRQEVFAASVKLAKHVGYVGLGTVEFLVDGDGKAFFLEVNPRVQVEHTVTEMITGVDLLQASILVAAGRPISCPEIGINSQDGLSIRGAAIQCRITTEDPLNHFAPDTGTIIAYRPAAGFGIRLDEGHGTAGGIITPHYDSLLVKVTAWGRSLEIAAAKMGRSLGEFRIRGVKHNIPLLANVVRHPAFLQSKMGTDFFDKHPEVFQYRRPNDRATKLLKYIADVSVNNPHGVQVHEKAPGADIVHEWSPRADRPSNQQELSAKQIFQRAGATGLVQWIKDQRSLLLTDTTMRDAHQSLFATRLRTHDILGCGDFYRDACHGLFSLEMWGGATFDTALRFLKEDPWERLAKVREQIPNSLLQMLLRGDNAVGYTNYPEWVIREFIREAVRTGLDVFRIFDCLNQVDKMQVAVEEVKSQGAVAEVCICYTGNLVDPREKKYTLAYYLNLAKDISRMGADILCIKDMAGLLRPKAATVLIKALRETVDLPIHLHTHDTAGVGVCTLLHAAEAGCHIVDGAVSSMAGLTSQPSLNALIAAMGGDPRCPQVPLQVLDELAVYWAIVRNMYVDFDPGIRTTSTDVYTHEIPGGQYSNLFQQAREVGLSPKEFVDLTHRYQEVNGLLGNIIKVTPSSKVVGDFALLLQKQGLTGPSLLVKRPHLDYPDSVVSFFKGHMGIPYGGFPEEVRTLVLGKDASPPETPPAPEMDSLVDVSERLEKQLNRPVSKQEAISYRLYPKVFLDFIRHREHFGRVDQLTTPVFFYGLKQGQEVSVDIEPGKTLLVTLTGVSKANNRGKRTIFFNLNGYPREIEVLDQAVGGVKSRKPKADMQQDCHLGATMPCKVIDVRVKEGMVVRQGDIVVITEAMKMEYAVSAKVDGVVAKVYVNSGDQMEEGDLLVELMPVAKA